ncbi:MAG: RnfABCDGE type electron transport complex subunit B [Muribaculaceae bacterium]|nr:RnfABCDGE type electron transport complex subunit B [Muribaculaceae bacterium]
MSVLTAIMVLGGIGAIGAIALNRVAKKFHVEEDALVGQVESLLPGVNCGGCGMNGCHDFAVQCVKAGRLEGFYCPSAGSEGMDKIAEALGCTSSGREPDVAVMKCAGTSSTKRAFASKYEGVRRCSIMNMTAGDYDCDNSCLGCGDCMDVCQWQAINYNATTGIVEISAEKCVGCGMCVSTCPRRIIELRPRNRRNRRVWVACSNCQKGAVTRKQCSVGCIGCGLCAKQCPVDAISISDNLAYIDPAKCVACGKCIGVCPTKAIQSVNVGTARPATKTTEDQ